MNDQANPLSSFDYHAALVARAIAWAGGGLLLIYFLFALGSHGLDVVQDIYHVPEDAPPPVWAVKHVWSAQRERHAERLAYEAKLAKEKAEAEEQNRG